MNIQEYPLVRFLLIIDHCSLHIVLGGCKIMKSAEHSQLCFTMNGTFFTNRWFRHAQPPAIIRCLSLSKATIEPAEGND